MPGKHLLVLFSFLSILFSCTHRDDSQIQQDSDTLAPTMLVRIDSLRISKYLNQLGVSKEVSASVYRIYDGNDALPIWTDGMGMRPQASMAASFFWKYLSNGIIDSSLFLPGMHSLFDHCLGNQHPNAAVNNETDLEVSFTCQVVVFFESLLKVRKPRELGQIEWYIPLRKNRLSSDLNWSSIAAPEKLIEESPAHHQVPLLLKALDRLMEIERSGGWPLIKVPQKSFIVGDTSDVIAEVKRRLHIDGAYNRVDSTNRFDEYLVMAVRKARQGYGLKDTPLVDSVLINRLNISIAERIETVKINLERWKWVPRDTADTMIQVNVASFELEVVQGRKTVKRMSAIAGDTMHHTVMFYDELQQIVFNPYWNIPKSILEKEIWPNILRDRAYLRRNHMEILKGTKVIDPSQINWRRYSAKGFPYNIRQKPGHDNPLGDVKFLFPNPYSIYLHDTPNKQLFDKRIRSFSHGCIRIAEPIWLASYLLNGQDGWNDSAITEVMRSDQETLVNLPSRIPVHITYFTSWVDENGMLHFRDDVYGHDSRMREVWKPKQEK